jgi:hypothetical protein
MAQSKIPRLSRSSEFQSQVWSSSLVTLTMWAASLIISPNQNSLWKSCKLSSSADHFEDAYFRSWPPGPAQSEPSSPITRRYPLSTSSDRRPALLDLPTASTAILTRQAPPKQMPSTRIESSVSWSKIGCERVCLFGSGPFRDALHNSRLFASKSAIIVTLRSWRRVKYCRKL